MDDTGICYDRTTQFFLPAATLDTQEASYAKLAGLCGRPVPVLAERIYSMTFVHDGERWTATVGETLSGVRIDTKRSRNKRIERKTHLDDPATVLAIFSGVPFLVATTGGITVPSKWGNPFLAGQPESIVRFAVKR